MYRICNVMVGSETLGCKVCDGVKAGSELLSGALAREVGQMQQIVCLFVV